MVKKKYYVIDVNGIGCADVVTTLPKDYCHFIAECDDKETAYDEAEKYETKVYEELVAFSREIDKTIENYDYDDYE